jgi:hypothetical protein
MDSTGENNIEHIEQCEECFGEIVHLGHEEYNYDSDDAYGIGSQDLQKFIAYPCDTA